MHAHVGEVSHEDGEIIERVVLEVNDLVRGLGQVLGDIYGVHVLSLECLRGVALCNELYPTRWIIVKAQRSECIWGHNTRGSAMSAAAQRPAVHPRGTTGRGAGGVLAGEQSPHGLDHAGHVLDALLRVVRLIVVTLGGEDVAITLIGAGIHAHAGGVVQEHAHIDATGGLIAVLVEQVLELIGQVEVGSAERVAESLVLVQAGDGLVDILGRRLHDGLLGELWGSALPHPLMNPTLPDRRSAVQPE